MSRNRVFWLRVIILPVVMLVAMIIKIDQGSGVVVSGWGDLLLLWVPFVFAIFLLVVIAFIILKFYRDEPLVKETKEEENREHDSSRF